MKTPAAIARTFSIRRVYDAAQEEVFDAFADPDLKAEWFSGPPDKWRVLDRSFDFREGGEERVRGKFEGGFVSDFRARYHVIRQPALLVYVYDMYVDERLLSTSLSSFDFLSAGKKTELVYVEQAVYYDGEDGSASREEGTLGLFDRIADALAARRA
jgi:uncharacterized protein YndB with AHSA1/START domain